MMTQNYVYWAPPMKQEGNVEPVAFVTGSGTPSETAAAGATTQLTSKREDGYEADDA